MIRTARTRWRTRLLLFPGWGRVCVNRKKAPPERGAAAGLAAVLLGQHKVPLVPPAIHAAQHARAGREHAHDHGRLYRRPGIGRYAASGNEIPDNGRPYGAQLSALPACTERAVATPDPDWAFLICLDAFGEFGRSGLVALRRASVIVVRRTSGKKHQQAHRGQYGREWVHGEFLPITGVPR